MRELTPAKKVEIHNYCITQLRSGLDPETNLSLDEIKSYVKFIEELWVKDEFHLPVEVQ